MMTGTMMIKMTRTAVIGPDGKGRLWQAPPDDEEDEELYGLTTEDLTKSQSPGYDPSTLFAKRKAMQLEEGDDFSEKDGEHSVVDVLSGFDDVEFGTGDPYGRQKDVDVIGELKAICLEYEPTSPIENLAIELNSFKFSQNAEYSDCTMAVTLAILEKMEITTDTTDAKLVAEFKSVLEHWAPLLQKMSIGQDEEKAIILGIERTATDGGGIGEKLSSGNAFRFLLQTIYNEGIVSEEAVLAWSEERKTESSTDSSSPRVQLYCRQPVQEFLEWLVAEESSDDEEESNDEDDSDDE
jgi:translation initiation factor eIF-2B subunit epsilon